MAFLSPTRFAHVFKDQVGLPFSRYMLWRKLTRAMVAIGSERTIAAAAHAADFADAAHLTRTFYQMFGMAPSVLMRGEFVEIPSPFSRFVQAISSSNCGVTHMEGMTARDCTRQCVEAGASYVWSPTARCTSSPTRKTNGCGPTPVKT